MMFFVCFIAHQSVQIQTSPQGYGWIQTAASAVVRLSVVKPAASKLQVRLYYIMYGKCRQFTDTERENFRFSK